MCNAALDNALLSIDPTIKKIIYSGDIKEGKYDDTRDDGNKDMVRGDNGDEEGGNDEDKDKDREDDKDEDDDTKEDDVDDNNFYKILFFHDDDDSIDDLKYCVPLAREAGVQAASQRVVTRISPTLMVCLNKRQRWH